MRALAILCLLAILPGCVSLNLDTAPIAAQLPGIASQFAAGGGTTQALAGSCQTTPADGSLYGDSSLGAYSGVELPASFSVFHDQGAVTARITEFATDTSAEGRGTWTDFQCLYPSAMAVWDTQPHDVNIACASDVNPAGGVITGGADLGVYAGMTLPGSFSVYDDEQAVTDRISEFADDESSQGVSTWAAFQCYYSQAVAAWNSIPYSN